MVRDSPHFLDVNALNDSTITSVRLYPSKAQITRVFKLNVNVGQNQVFISSLPNVLEPESLRVQGRGLATILNVSSSVLDKDGSEQFSSRLTELRIKNTKVKNAIARAIKARKIIDDYVDTVDSMHLDISKLGEAVDTYDTTEERWDDRLAQLELELDAISEEIREEKNYLQAKASSNLNMRTRVAIELVATAGEVEIDISYVVSRACWKAAYDIRVDMENAAVPAKVTYKAFISQQTGESWKDVPLILETANPAFGNQVPTLGAWYISEKRRSNPFFDKLEEIHYEEDELQEHHLEAEAAAEPEPEPETHHDSSFVSSVGNVHFTFHIANPVSITSDNKEYSVVIAELDLETTMTWLCVPKRELRVYLRSSITNSSEYTLLSGDCNIFIDQSFVAQSLMPRVSPQERFDCDFGVDPSIRVTYHMNPRKISESGFITKAQRHDYVCNITIHNMKVIDIAGLKLIDHIPVSRNAKIAVNLIEPKLVPPPSSGTTTGERALSPTIIAEGVVAQWSIPNGQYWDGHLEWICAVPAQSNINLTLHWEVSAALMIDIDGL